MCQVFLGTAVSPSPAASVCWAFCLSPREPVGPAGLCAQGLGGSCAYLVLLGVVVCRQPCCGPGCEANPRLWACPRGSHLLIWVRTHPSSGVAPRPLIEVRAHPGTLGLCAQAAVPFIRVSSHLVFQLWVPSPLIWVQANRASGVCWGCLSHVHC